MKKNRRRYVPTQWILILVLIIVGMGIGYAALETNLEIVGVSDVDSATWDVYFANIQVTGGSVSASTPTITDKTSLFFSANLENPGEFYEFTVDVINAGTLDAKLDAIQITPVLTSTQKNYFNYTVTYADRMPIEVGDALEVGQTEKILIRFEYLTQTDTSLYPTDDTNFNFGVTMSYIQGNGNKKIFSVSSTTLTTGQQMITGVQTFDNYQDAISSLGKPFFTKHKIVNNIVSSSVVGFVINSKPYYIKAASDDRYFEENKKVLIDAFGDFNCNVTSSVCFCNNGVFQSGVYTQGYVLVADDAITCSGEDDGRHSCFMSYSGGNGDDGGDGGEGDF